VPSGHHGTQTEIVAAHAAQWAALLPWQGLMLRCAQVRQVPQSSSDAQPTSFTG